MPRIGPFEIQEELGRGSAGVVYRVTKPPEPQSLALKVLFPSALEAAGGLTRFRREANALLTLDHPGIVRVYETGSTAKGQPYIALAFESGGSLRDRLRRGPLPIAEAVSIARQLCEAVAHAHDHGILHRDLKPHNVLFSSEGRPLITDFGLSRDVGHDERITKTGEMIGTPTYMPPEQIQGEPSKIGPPSDIYGLGGVLYVMLCGESPFRGASVLDVLKAAVNDPPRPPSSLRPEVDARLEAIVLRCLAKEPGDRYPDARSLAHDLAAWAPAAAPPPAPPAPASPPAPEPNWGLRFALCGVALIGLAFAVLAVWISTRPAPAAAAAAEPSPTATTAAPSPVATPTPTPTASPRRGERAESRRACERAVRALKARDWKSALQAAESAVRLHRSRESLRVRATARFRSRRFPGALEDCDALIAMHPEAAQFWVQRGHVKWELGRKAEARADFRKAHELAPKSVYALNALGWAAWQLDADAAAAEALWTESVGLEPTAAGLAGLAWVASHRKHTKLSLERAEEALAIDPHEPRAQEVRAVALMRMGNLSKACEAFEALAARFPKNYKFQTTSLTLAWKYRDKRTVLRRLRAALMHFPEPGHERKRLLQLRRQWEQLLEAGE